MRQTQPEERIIRRVGKDEFVPFSPLSTGELVLQANPAKPLGVGLHLFRIEPGCTTTPHNHTGDEEFFVIEGEVVDNDGTVYRQGDLVWLKMGTQHSSYSKEGALLAVYVAVAESTLS